MLERLNWIAAIVAISSTLFLTAAPAAKMLRLTLRSRVEPFKGSGEWQEVHVTRDLPASRAALVICDMWDRHWCEGAAKRVEALARKASPVIDLARAKGVLIIHAPSETMPYYRDDPARLSLLAIPKSEPPEALALSDPPLPIDDSDGGCDTPNNPLQPNTRVWTRESQAIRIAPADLISDDGAQVYSALKLHGIDTLFFMGVHTNMCILNRSFGIRQMTRWGIRCILIRDLTDAMYNPEQPPHVTHDQGTQLVIEHIEKYWAPTITSDELTRALKESGLMNRRVFVSTLAATAVAAADPAPKLKLCIFSKHLQWAKWDEMAAFAKAAGFDGVDLTVRSGGHVLPERVADDLPRAVEAIRNAGLEAPMITAGIVDASSPHAEAILAAASGLGIQRYRWGGLRYRDDQPLPAQLAEFRPRVRALADMNQHYRITAMYHTHSGMEVGAPIWDLWEILRAVDSKWVGVNYDVGHATAEGGFGGWIRSFQVCEQYVRGVALKDFLWGRNDKGEWRPQWKPAGQGMVDFPRFFAMLKRSGFAGPVQVHFEYSGIGGADQGKSTLGIPKSELMTQYRRDVTFYRERMSEAGLI